MGMTNYINKLRAKLCSKIALKRSNEEAIGYFAYTRAGEVCCDGEACIIAGSKELMKTYLSEMSGDVNKDIIKQTYYDEVMAGIEKGGAYAFDKESYDRFLHAYPKSVPDAFGYALTQVPNALKTAS